MRTTILTLCAALSLSACNRNDEQATAPAPTTEPAPAQTAAVQPVRSYVNAYEEEQRLKKDEALEKLGETATALVIDPRQVVNGWVSSVHALKGERPSYVIDEAEQAVWGTNYYYWPVAHGIAQAFMTKADNVRYVRGLVKNLLPSVQVSPAARLFMASGDPVFQKPFMLTETDMEAWYTDFHRNRYATEETRPEAPADWVANYGTLEESKMWWYMFLYRRYLEGGMPLVQEYQGFAKEALTALNTRPEYATPATP